MVRKKRRCMALVIIATAFLVLSLAVWISPAQAITYGRVDESNDYPYVGSIVVDNWPVYGVIQYCSGTLIAPRVFLTAAHCTEGLRNRIESGFILASDVKVSFDNLDIFDESTWVDVDELHSHPGYKFPHLDVGVLILASPAGNPDILPAPLPEEGLPMAGFLNVLKKEGFLVGHGQNKAIIQVVGYGDHLDWPPPDIFSSEGERWIADSEYRGLTKESLITSMHPALENGGTCYGDSGGPGFLEYGGSRYLVSVTSWGDANCIALDVRYRVDLQEVLDFIADMKLLAGG